MADEDIDLEESKKDIKEELLKNIIKEIYLGSSKFYYAWKKVEIISLIDEVEDLFGFIEKNKIKSFSDWEKITAGLPAQEQQYMVALAKKTAGNMMSSGLEHKDIIKGSQEIIKNVLKDKDKGKFKIEYNGKEIPPKLSLMILLALGNFMQFVRGGLRSFAGKNVAKIILSIMFESLNFSEFPFSDFKDNQDIETGFYYLLEKKYRIRGEELKIELENQPSSESSQETDAMLLYYDAESKKLYFLTVIEFTIGGTGNPTAAVHKANSVGEKFRRYIPEGLVFFTFNLNESMQSKIEGDINTITFYENKEGKSLERLYKIIKDNISKNSLNDSDLNSIEDAKKDYKDKIKAYISPYKLSDA